MAEDKNTKLAEKILADARAYQDRQQQRERERREKIQGLEFDPFEAPGWAILAGPDPGYLPTTPMRQTSIGFMINCRACGDSFESKGLAYCKSCYELPAKDREAMSPVVHGRMCQAPGCENPVPRKARSDARYCSGACASRARRHTKNVADNAAAGSEEVAPQNVADNVKKDQ